MTDSDDRVRVFISWSGTRGRAVAEAFNWWLPLMFDALDPWISGEDIHKGAEWPAELKSGLRRAAHGLVVLTPESQNAPWIHYESGVLAASIKEEALLWTILVGGLTPTDVTGPLENRNHTKLDKSDIQRLVKSVNGSLPVPLDDGRLSGKFDQLWLSLSERLEVVPQESPEGEPTAPVRTDRQLIEELVERVRGIEGEVARPGRSDVFGPYHLGGARPLLPQHADFDQFEVPLIDGLTVEQRNQLVRRLIDSRGVSNVEFVPVSSNEPSGLLVMYAPGEVDGSRLRAMTLELQDQMRRSAQ